VTILFADIVDFTGLASGIPPTDLVDLLNQIFTTFDQLAERYRLEKIKTIGDAYMVVGGVPDPHPTPVAAVAEMALAMQQVIGQFQRPDRRPFCLRIGIHTGAVVAGVIGSKKFIYDLWGDAVNVASRMESQGIPGGIRVTEATYQALREEYHLQPQGTLNVKGRGEMAVYGLQGRRDEVGPMLLERVRSPRVDVVTVAQAQACGVQRFGFPLDIGLDYDQCAYHFQEWVRLEQALAVDFALSQFRDPDRGLLVASEGGFRLYVHRPELKGLPYSAGLAGMCQRMRQEIEVMDRRWRLRFFSRCFVGQEAVTWLATTYQISRNQAVALGQDCLLRGLISHVVSEQDFADAYFFYRFRQDGAPSQRWSEKLGLIPRSWPAAARSSSPDLKPGAVLKPTSLRTE